MACLEYSWNTSQSCRLPAPNHLPPHECSVTEIPWAIFYFLGESHIKWTILKCVIQWHLVYSHCSATTTSIEFQNIFITPKSDSIPNKQLFPIFTSYHLLETTSLLSAYLSILHFLYKWNHIIYIFCVQLISPSIMFWGLSTF